MEIIDNISFLGHATIRITGNNNKILYFDPFHLSGSLSNGDYIFCTHSHFDHYSEEDIKKILKQESVLIIPEELKEKAKQIHSGKILPVKPYEKHLLDDITIQTIPAYNIGKKFHPRENNWVGYIVTLDSATFYIAGDTDFIPEMKEIKVDIAFLPVGGTYTMNPVEASKAANTIKPRYAIPIHYGDIIGNKNDAQKFLTHLDKEITGLLL